MKGQGTNLKIDQHVAQTITSMSASLTYRHQASQCV